MRKLLIQLTAAVALASPAKADGAWFTINSDTGCVPSPASPEQFEAVLRLNGATKISDEHRYFDDGRLMFVKVTDTDSQRGQPEEFNQFFFQSAVACMTVAKMVGAGK